MSNGESNRNDHTMARDRIGIPGVVLFLLAYFPTFGHALLLLSPSSILIIHKYCSSLIACLINLTHSDDLSTMAKQGRLVAIVAYIEDFWHFLIAVMYTNCHLDVIGQ